MEKEIWKDIQGYEGYYQISNFARVKSLLRTVNKSNGSKQTMPEKIMSTSLSPHYKTVSLSLNSIPHRFYIHKLVAGAFISNPYNKPQVNHINGIKTDNRLENLEWCTVSENSKHAIKTGLLTMPDIKGINNGRCKLSEANVISIRKLAGKLTLFEIGNKFSIGKAQVSCIINRKNWTHI